MTIENLILEYEKRKEVHEAKLYAILQKNTYTQKDCDAIFAHKVAISMTNEFLKSLKNVK
jgi:hypothetical protein